MNSEIGRRKAQGLELRENEAALRQMRVIAWLLVAFVFGGLCLWAGLYIGWKMFGG